jgi:hypothetical protein
MSVQNLSSIGSALLEIEALLGSPCSKPVSPQIACKMPRIQSFRIRKALQFITYSPLPHIQKSSKSKNPVRARSGAAYMGWFCYVSLSLRVLVLFLLLYLYEMHSPDECVLILINNTKRVGKKTKIVHLLNFFI